jgi:aspartyl-tRNA(Asn)/glutamyl-tRNA(Gln) amidotransferase subunit A
MIAELLTTRDDMTAHACKLFVDVDVLIMPTVPGPPSLIEPIADNAARDPERTRNTWPFDVTGLPAISVPCGFSRSGLPIGLQIVGAPFAESTVLAVAYAYEQATEWHRRKPASSFRTLHAAAGRTLARRVFRT